MCISSFSIAPNKFHYSFFAYSSFYQTTVLHYHSQMWLWLNLFSMNRNRRTISVLIIFNHNCTSLINLDWKWPYSKMKTEIYVLCASYDVLKRSLKKNANCAIPELENFQVQSRLHLSLPICIIRFVMIKARDAKKVKSKKIQKKQYPKQRNKWIHIPLKSTRHTYKFNQTTRLFYPNVSGP